MTGSRTRTTLTIGAALSALALLTAPAIAQKYADDGEIVILPPVYSEGAHGRGDGPNERVTGTVIVSTRDLDLRNDADVQELQQRISDGARQACEDAEARLRAEGGNPGVDQPLECYRSARLNALREARLMVYYARG